MPEQAVPVNVAAALSEKVLLICPTLSFWQGRAMLPKEQVSIHFQSGSTGVTGTPVTDLTPATQAEPSPAMEDAPDDDIVLDDETTTRTQVVLMTDRWPAAGAPDGRPWKKIFNKLRSKQSGIVNKYSTCFPGMFGVRIVPKVAGVALFTELNELKRELEVVAEGFCTHLSQIRDEIQSRLPEKVWNSIKHKIPATKELMRKKFGSAALPIEISTGTSSTVLSMAELREFRGEIQSEIESRVGAAVEEMIAAPRRELANAIDDLVEKLSRQTNVTDRSFNAARGAFEKLKHFSFAASPELLQRMGQVENTLRAADPALLRSSSTSRERLVASIQGIVSELRDGTQIADSIAAFKTHQRRVAV